MDVNSITVTTLNTLNDYHGAKWHEKPCLNEKGLNAEKKEVTDSAANGTWRNYVQGEGRTPALAANIQMGSIVCVQELSRERLSSLQAALEPQGYKLAQVVYHEAFLPEKTENTPFQQFGNAIFYDSNIMTLEDHFEIQYSAGKTGRSAACACFKVGQKTHAVASVHLTGYWEAQPDPVKKEESKQAGLNELKHYNKQLEDRVKGFADIITIAGDFNEDANEADTPSYRPGYLLDQGYAFDGSLAVTEPSKGRRIDWLFCKALNGTVQVTPMNLDAQHIASDHLMTGSHITPQL